MITEQLPICVTCDGCGDFWELEDMADDALIDTLESEGWKADGYDGEHLCPACSREAGEE